MSIELVWASPSPWALAPASCRSQHAYPPVIGSGNGGVGHWMLDMKADGHSICCRIARTHGARRNCCTCSSKPRSVQSSQGLQLSGVMRFPCSLYHHSHHSENFTVG